MPTADDYNDLSEQELRDRLAKAEAVAVLFGWEAVRSGPGGEALTQAWMEWSHLVGEDFTSPRRHPDLDERRIHELVEMRRDIRARTLRRIREDHPDMPDPSESDERDAP